MKYTKRNIFSVFTRYHSEKFKCLQINFPLSSHTPGERQLWRKLRISAAPQQWKKLYAELQNGILILDTWDFTPTNALYYFRTLHKCLNVCLCKCGYEQTGFAAKPKGKISKYEIPKGALSLSADRITRVYTCRRQFC